MGVVLRHKRAASSFSLSRSLASPVELSLAAVRFLAMIFQVHMVVCVFVSRSELLPKYKKYIVAIITVKGADTRVRAICAFAMQCIYYSFTQLHNKSPHK